MEVVSLHASAFVPTALALVGLLIAAPAAAEGEEVDGFPNYRERVYLQWANRARVDPQLEMTACGDNCPDAACYTVEPPLYHSDALAHASRFHAQEMQVRGFFSHESNCTLVDDLPEIWPSTCDGSADCACVGGVAQCTGACTRPEGRTAMFGAGYAGEISVGVGDPDFGFYLWLHEPSTSDECVFGNGNGHRYLLLTSQGSVGFGAFGSYGNGDFGFGGGDHPIPSGTHYPRSGGNVTVWANWFADQAPTMSTVNVDGQCEPMMLERGVAENGTFSASPAGLQPQACHRYYFVFKDAAGQRVTYPTTGSLGIGAEGACPDWSEQRPPLGDGCDCMPSCDGRVCGDNGCGFPCGECSAGEQCDQGTCVAEPPGGDGGGGPDDPSAADGGGAGSGPGAGPDGGGSDEGGALPGGFGNNEYGDGCRVDPRPPAAPMVWLMLTALVARRRRD